MLKILKRELGDLLQIVCAGLIIFLIIYMNMGTEEEIMAEELRKWWQY